MFYTLADNGNTVKERKMCPCMSSRSIYAVCGKYEEGLMVPSVFERENYCLAIYELCPIFSPFVVPQEARERVCEPAGV